jgi:S1-C subfamily serine protease
LGAEIPRILLDVHVQPGWSTATVASRGEITVDWQLYDTFAQKVVYKKTLQTPFHKKGKLNDNEPELIEMFRLSIRELLAQEDFAAFMRPGADTAGTLQTSAENLLRITETNTMEAFPLPESFPRVMESFLSVEPGNALGSGFLISSDGYALTAAHVVAGLKTVPVRLKGGMVLEATVVRTNEDVDIALLKLPGMSFPPLALLPESSGTIGSEVYAIGNPAAKELNASVSRGVVSGNREIAGRKFVQTDAAANPGSSGGPLLDRSGRVLGVISWKFAGAEYQGLAFAVQIRDALRLMNVAIDK